MSSHSIPSTLNFHSNGGTYPPHGIITPSDHGPIVVVTTWVMMCLTSLTLMARLGTRRSLSKDNLIITLAALLAIAHGVLIHIAADFGLGRHRIALSASHLEIYSKARYTSQILEIVILCLAKSSLLVVFMHLTPSRPAIMGLRLLAVSLLFWGLAAVFALLFQCQRPDTWDLTSSRCQNQVRDAYSSNG
ncbi:MAG: hypothetical protein L6R39_001326 [Caloplaca ligustica]|nr:MAG: hypothetical protein L6R39_001326 [Caloplaca ligustica]